MAPVINGVLNIDKSPGSTSMDVVRRIKRLSSQRHVGHGGTLDPQASGVLPVCLGQATRLMQFLVGSSKEYLATVRLGVVTDTYDAEGKVVSQQDSSAVTPQALETSLNSLRGTIYQTPPMYSALKRDGRRLYEFARSGVELERAPRKVEVLRLDLVDWAPPLLSLEIEAGRGVYIRSLAYDLGQLLGCGAHLAGLRRIRTGPFHIDSAVSLDQVEKMFQHGSWQSILYASDYIALHLRAVVVSKAEEEQLLHGKAMPLTPRTHYAQHLEQCRAYSIDGRFIALVRFDRNVRLWQPFKVFHSETTSPYKLERALT